MSSDDNIFLATDEAVGDVAGWFAEALSLKPAVHPDLKDGAYLFRGRARSADGELFVVVEPNVYGEAEPEPEDVSAIDRYQGVADVRYAGAKDEELQAREARALFDELAVQGDSVAMILSHNMALAVAAYLPGAGTQIFPPGTSLDVEDAEIWRPWLSAESVPGL